MYINGHLVNQGSAGDTVEIEFNTSINCKLIRSLLLPIVCSEY